MLPSCCGKPQLPVLLFCFFSSVQRERITVAPTEVWRDSFICVGSVRCQAYFWGLKCRRLNWYIQCQPLIEALRDELQKIWLQWLTLFVPRAVLPIPARKGSLHPRVVPAEGDVSPHLHCSQQETFAAANSRDVFEHDTACWVELGKWNVGCFLPPWNNNLWQGAGSSHGSMATVETLVWAATERRGGTSCFGPVSFLSGICFHTAARASWTGAGRESVSPFPNVAIHAAPQHQCQRAQLWQPPATAAFKHMFSTQDSQHPWGWGQLFLRGCSSFAVPQNGISTCLEKEMKWLKAVGLEVPPKGSEARCFWPRGQFVHGQCFEFSWWRASLTG